MLQPSWVAVVALAVHETTPEHQHRQRLTLPVSLAECLLLTRLLHSPRDAAEGWVCSFTWQRWCVLTDQHTPVYPTVFLLTRRVPALLQPLAQGRSVGPSGPWLSSVPC